MQRIAPLMHACASTRQAFSTLGRNIDFTTQDSCSFYNQIALYDNFGGVVIGADEGDNIAKALGDDKKGERRCRQACYQTTLTHPCQPSSCRTTGF